MKLRGTTQVRSQRIRAKLQYFTSRADRFSRICKASRLIFRHQRHGCLRNTISKCCPPYDNLPHLFPHFLSRRSVCSRPGPVNRVCLPVSAPVVKHIPRLPPFASLC